MASKQTLKNMPWLSSRVARRVWAAVGLVLAYAFVSRALDTGSYWQYLGALAFLILGINMLKRSFEK